MGDVKCRTGGKAEFACEIDDPDQKNVKWFKDGKEIKVYILFRYLYIKWESLSICLFDLKQYHHFSKNFCMEGPASLHIASPCERNPCT